MGLAWGRDKRGRVYWYDPATGRRAKAPRDEARPRAYRKDKRGRGYWVWLDTGRRAPKPPWDAAPRYDRAGRPLDSTGRRVPRAALQAEPVLGPPKKPPEEKPRRKKAPEPVRPKLPARVRAFVRGIGQAVEGFHQGEPLYFTKPTRSTPRGLDDIFRSWLKGAVIKSPVASSASEIGFRQHGIVFRAEAPLDRVALAELTDALRGQPVRVVYKVTGANEWEIWLHLNRPERRTGEVKQAGYRSVTDRFRSGERAAQIVYDYLLDEWDADVDWFEYYETEDTVYEG